MLSLDCPKDFGHDRDLVETMPFAAPEIIDFEGQTYIAVLQESSWPN
jgi:hypothetical protein